MASSPSYAGFDLKTANNFIKISKWFSGIFICLQLFDAYRIYNLQNHIMEIEGSTRALSAFLLTTPFISISVTIAITIIYLFSRKFWYTLFLGSFLLVKTTLGFFRELRDGFSTRDLYFFMQPSSALVLLLYVAAF